MTTTIQPTIDDFLDALMTGGVPNADATREAVRVAVTRVARENGGLVHIAQMRPLLPASAQRPQIGAVMNRLARRGYLVATGHYRPNGDAASRNQSKPSPVWRLMRPIPPEAVQS